jgi:hypothetical protein
VAALCWGAVGKDPGLTPISLLELLKRHGRYRPEDFTRLQLVSPFDLLAAKATWRGALAAAERFARERAPDELGCLYYSLDKQEFVLPRSDVSLEQQRVAPHFGEPGGVVPRPSDSRLEMPGQKLDI